MDESGTTIRDEATRVAEEEQTARLLEIDQENWRRSGLMGPDISDATMEAHAMMENSPQAIESELQGGSFNAHRTLREGSIGWRSSGQSSGQESNSLP
jgi:hypothetical protein